MSAKNKRWVAKVKTDSTHPRAGLFTKSPSTIARELASKKVSPKGPQSGMRMLNYFINRAGRGLSASRRAKLENREITLVETNSWLAIWGAGETKIFDGPQTKVLKALCF